MLYRACRWEKSIFFTNNYGRLYAWLCKQTCIFELVIVVKHVVSSLCMVFFFLLSLLSCIEPLGLSSEYRRQDWSSLTSLNPSYSVFNFLNYHPSTFFGIDYSNSFLIRSSAVYSFRISTWLLKSSRLLISLIGSPSVRSCWSGRSIFHIFPLGRIGFANVNARKRSLLNRK